MITVSTLAPAEMGLGEVYLSLPAIVGRSGIDHVIARDLVPQEEQALKASADVIKRYIAALE